MKMYVACVKNCNVGHRVITIITKAADEVHAKDCLLVISETALVHILRIMCQVKFINIPVYKNSHSI